MNPQLLACRIALAGLIKVIEKLCSDFCKRPELIPEYQQAKELLK
jgi:hypothetical protein